MIETDLHVIQARKFGDLLKILKMDKKNQRNIGEEKNLQASKLS